MDTKKLRQKILDLAIHGKLVPQDPNDEPASVLLERIRAEKKRLIAEGKIKRSKKAATSDTSHYENVPFEVPENWEWTNLGEITNYGNCETVDVNDIPSNGWVLELEDLEKDSAKIIQRLTKDERDIKGVRHSFHKGDVLYSKLRTYLNKVMVAPEDGFCTTEIIPVTCMSFILPEYLNHVLRSKYFVDYTIQCGYGVKMPRLSTTDACNGQIPLPPYNEQKHIVASIERWFQIIDILESDKLDLDEAIQKTKSKILNLAIHGKLVPQDPNDEPASELLNRINPKAVASCDNPHYEQVPFEIPSNWLWVKLGDVTNYGKCSTCSVDDINNESWILELEDIEKDTGRILVQHTKAEREIKGVRHSFYAGNILYSKLRTYLNKVLVAKEDGFCTTEIIPIECCDSVHPDYICNILRSKYFLDYTAQCGYGVKMPRLSTTDARKALIPLPPYKEQIRISEKIDVLMGSLNAIAEMLVQ